ncbi:hypothetical protein [Azonexus sp.]|jgi:sortase (surface protein transpeptidase)|uniref:hypothetical protein n=1 Tax=Azonexus sp. TaxID=1872668 RepID=UPI0028177387|nr:hypothetical protein [Azonexus sp.]MDR1994428.1 hypothetical protein [Azonexus sp.]
MDIQSVSAGSNPFVTSSNTAQTQQAQQAQQTQQAQQARQAQQTQQVQQQVPPQPVTNAQGQTTGTLINVAA